MKLFLTSDEHYFHDNIVKLNNRPFTIEEMNSKLVEKFNSKVGENDTTYHLGDFTLGKAGPAIGILEQLNGMHFFIRGNHDKWLPEGFTHPKILGIKDLHEIKREEHRMVLCHFPMLSWHHSYRGTFMLHGHCHAKINKQNEGVRRLDVGVDSAYKILGDFVPFSFEEVRDLLVTSNPLDI